MVDTLDPGLLDQFHKAIAERDNHTVQELLSHVTPHEESWLLSRLDREEQALLLSLAEPKTAAILLEAVTEGQAANVLRDLDPAQAAPIIDCLPSNRQVDLIAVLAPAERDAVLSRLPKEDAADAIRLMAYPNDVAGGLMITEYLSYRRNQTVGDMLDDLHANRNIYADYDVQYTYIEDDMGRLVGVLRLRDVLFAERDAHLKNLMLTKLHHVRDYDSLDELIAFFTDHALMGVPVIDSQDRLVGVVRRGSVQKMRNERNQRRFLAFTGIVGGEELRSMPLWTRSTRRLMWLSINIVLNLVAASVIAMYQSTLEQVIALAVFLPIISDMSGCSGNQAVAVSMRELSVGLVKPREVLWVLGKEASLGVINGLSLGALLALITYLWTGTPMLGLVVGGALALNTLVSVSLGGSLPLLLQRFKFDPALVSGPALTTVTDMCGFFFTLSFATMTLPYLVGTA